jgi:hypothetical protein
MDRLARRAWLRWLVAMGVCDFLWPGQPLPRWAEAVVLLLGAVAITNTAVAWWLGHTRCVERRAERAVLLDHQRHVAQLTTLLDEAQQGRAKWHQAAVRARRDSAYWQWVAGKLVPNHPPGQGLVCAMGECATHPHVPGASGSVCVPDRMPDGMTFTPLRPTIKPGHCHSSPPDCAPSCPAWDRWCTVLVQPVKPAEVWRDPAGVLRCPCHNLEVRR